MKDTVVIVGGAGFLGSHVADALSKVGYRVVIFDCQKSPWLKDDQEMVIGDILCQEDLIRAMQGAKYVYHMAGIADIGQAAANPLRTIEVNIMGSANVIEACLKNNIRRLIFASTIYVYSQQGSFYRVSKQAVESLLETYHQTRGLEYTILRFGSLYGPRAQDWNGLKSYVAQAVLNNAIIHPGDGNDRREYIHALDAAHLCVTILDEQYVNQSLILTGSQSLSSRELLIMIKEILGGDIELKFKNAINNTDHYALTPYRFTPKEARKIVPKEFFDLGQGLLEIAEQIYNESRATETNIHV